MIADADIVFLAETWERETCRIPDIPGYIIHSAYQPHVGRRGQGGVACIYKCYLEGRIDICKVDRHKRYIWIMLKHSTPMYIAGCYIPHKESPFYARYGVDPQEPLEDLSMDVCAYLQQGHVMVLGDLNARVGRMQFQPIAHDVLDKEEIVDVDTCWYRHSEDTDTNAHGRALMDMVNGLHMPILNGMNCFPDTTGYTCYSASGGSSVVDYAMIHMDALCMIKEFWLGEKHPESDHLALGLTLDICYHVGSAEGAVGTGAFRVDVDKKQAYTGHLDSLLSNLTMNTWADLRDAMLNTAIEVFGKPKTNHKHVKGLPCKKWFDDECKVARRALKVLPEGQERREAEKRYNALTRKKRRRYVVAKESVDAREFVKRPRQAWRKMHNKRSSVMGNFTDEEMLLYVTELYMHKGTQYIICDTHAQAFNDLFTLETLEAALNKMANGKACDTLQLNTEMLKWTTKETKLCMLQVLHHAFAHGFPHEWQENWIQPLFKGGDRNLLTNYRTIMVSSAMAKLFSTILEMQLSKWAESNNKRAHGQAGFRPDHNTIDHLVTLRVLMEESRLKGETLYCCFVDFKKAFDTVPRVGLWQRLQELGVPTNLCMGVYRIYQRVICRLKGRNGLSQTFESNMGVKQGCPLSPTLFGLCIDKLEETLLTIMHEEGISSPHIGMYVILLLLYADDVVFFTHTEERMQKFMEILEKFCQDSGLTVNVSKTKLMAVRTKQLKIPPKVHYAGQPIEVVSTFKYLGIEIPADHRWHTCVERRLAAGKSKYYQFENDCSHTDTKCWKIRCILFDAYVLQTVLYGVEVWGGSISSSIWNDIEKLQKAFIRRHLGIKSTTPYVLLLLETGRRPIEVYAMVRVLRYVIRVRQMDDSRLPKKAWAASTCLQKTRKSKVLSTGWVLNIQKWFKRWEVDRYLNMTPEDICMDTFQIDLLRAYQAKHQSKGADGKLAYYNMHIYPSCWESYMQVEAHTQPYIANPLSVAFRRNIARLRTRSHTLAIETGAWNGQMREMRLCKLCDLQSVESEEHMIMLCPAYAHIRADFDISLQGPFHQFLATSPISKLGALITRMLHFRETHTA